MGLSAGYLKLLFQNKKRLSVKRASEVAIKLAWDETKKVNFLESVINGSPKKARALHGKKILQHHDFFEISDWYHFAIIELIKVKKGKASFNYLLGSLGISKTQLNFALKHLIQLGLLETTGPLTFRVPDRYEVPSVSSAASRKYHKQTNELAINAIENQKFERRDFRGLTLAFDDTRIGEVKEEIEKFVSNFEKKFGDGALNSVYQLNFSFFQLNRGTK